MRGTRFCARTRKSSMQVILARFALFMGHYYWKNRGPKGRSNYTRAPRTRNRSMKVTQLATVHVIVTGFLQGVGYRHATVRRDPLLGVTGWGHNMDRATA